MQDTRDDEIEIDLLELFSVLLHWWWLILVSALLVGVAAFLFSTLMIPKEYQSSTEIYILNNGSSGNASVTYTDLQVGSYLTKDYAHLITTRDVLDQVIADLELTDSYGSLKDRVAVETPKDTRIVCITVTDRDPVMAQLIADRVRETASAHIKAVMALDAVNVASVANLPTSPSNPNILKWTVIGFVLGALLCAGIILLKFMLDDSIKTSEDVERFLALSTLGLIPVIDEEEARDRRKRRRVVPMELMEEAEAEEEPAKNDRAADKGKSEGREIVKDPVMKPATEEKKEGKEA